MLTCLHPGSLLALLDQKWFALALGIIRGLASGNLEAVTPLRFFEQVAGLRVGEFVADPVPWTQVKVMQPDDFFANPVGFPRAL